MSSTSKKPAPQAAKPTTKDSGRVHVGGSFMKF